MAIKMETPSNWLQMIDNIRKVRVKYPAPVDTMGCDQLQDRGSEKDVDQRFHILVSLMLSSQTKDQITWAAVQKLKQAGLGNVQAILHSREKDIEDLIHPVGFYRRKAIYLKKVAQLLADHYQGDIPASVEELCKLPGVGPKMAHLCMQEAWNVNSGIGVDTHVHRISARLGWVPKTGIKTPEDTRKALEQWMPREYWREINHLLVGFGQTICTPLRPKCGECFNNTLCPSSSVKIKKDLNNNDKETVINKNSAKSENTEEKLDVKPVGLVVTSKANKRTVKDNGKPKTATMTKKKIKIEGQISTEPETTTTATIPPTTIRRSTRSATSVKVKLEIV